MGLNFKKSTPQNETSGFVSQFIKYGVNLLKVNGIELKQSSQGDKYQIKFLVEGPEVGNGFSGAELPDGSNAKGLVGKVNLGVYFDPSNQARAEATANNLMFIAEKAGVADEVRNISEDLSFEDSLQEYAKIISGKFMWFIVQGEEYDKNRFVFKFKEGKVGQDSNGNKLFQVFCKHKDFASEVTEIDKDGTNVKVKGFNVVGSSIGKSDVLEFSYTYDLKPFETSDPEDDGDGTVDIGEDF